MHPALSVISFTTLSGMGYGLAFVLALGHGNPAALSTKIAWVAALGLISVGFLASTFHLGNPQRAWRAVSQWRSSWLSREGVPTRAATRETALCESCRGAPKLVIGLSAAMTRQRVLPLPVIRVRVKTSCTANTWLMPRAKMWLQAFVHPSPSTCLPTRCLKWPNSWNPLGT